VFPPFIIIKEKLICLNQFYFFKKSIRRFSVLTLYQSKNQVDHLFQHFISYSILKIDKKGGLHDFHSPEGNSFFFKIDFF